MKHNRWISIGLLLAAIALHGCDRPSAPAAQDKPSNTTHDSIAQSGVLDSINSLIAADSEQAAHYIARARLQLDQGHSNSALADVNKAMQLDSLSPEGWIALADVYFAKQRPVDSREALLKVLKIEPNNAVAMLKLSQLYAYIGDMGVAMTYANKALEVAPTNAEAHFIKSNLKLYASDTSSAVFHLHKATEIDPDYYLAWMLLGQVSEQQKRPIALQYYQSALNIDTNNTNTLYSIAMYYQNIQALEQAETTYQRILSKEDNTYAWYNLGYINMVYRDRYEEAIANFEKAYALQPNYIDALYNWGYALELNGNIKAAIAKYKEVLEKQTNHEKAIERLNELSR